MDDDDLVEIAAFSYRHQAEFAVSVLAAAGIDAVVRDGYFAGLRPHVMFAGGGVPVFVRARDAEEAARVLDSEVHPEGFPDGDEAE